jgi:hypothetical protein
MADSSGSGWSVSISALGLGALLAAIVRRITSTIPEASPLQLSQDLEIATLSCSMLLSAMFKAPINDSIIA